MVTPDSGTSLLTAPSWAFGILDDALPNDNKCDSKFEFGTLTYVIDGVDYDLPSNHFV